MFTDTLIESQSTPQLRPRLAAVLSMVFQAGVLGALILVPLLYPGALESFSVTPPVPLTTPAPMRQVADHVTPHPASSAVAPATALSTVMVRNDNALHYGPPRMIPDSAELPPSLNCCVVGPNPIGNANMTWLTNTPQVQPRHQQRVVISNLDPGMLIHRVEPRYPDIAKLTRVQGDVVIAAVISKSGEITGLQVMAGHPLLVAAAVDAVKQWRYRPYKLNGEALEVETQIVVRFHF